MKKAFEALCLALIFITLANTTQIDNSNESNACKQYLSQLKTISHQRTSSSPVSSQNDHLILDTHLQIKTQELQDECFLLGLYILDLSRGCSGAHATFSQFEPFTEWKHESEGYSLTQNKSHKIYLNQTQFVIGPHVETHLSICPTRMVITYLREFPHLESIEEINKLVEDGKAVQVYTNSANLTVELYISQSRYDLALIYAGSISIICLTGLYFSEKNLRKRSEEFEKKMQINERKETIPSPLDSQQKSEIQDIAPESPTQNSENTNNENSPRRFKASQERRRFKPAIVSKGATSW